MGRVYAILGDIHANIDALNVVLEDARAQGVTNFVSVGDVVGYNAAPTECIRIVRDELKCPVVRGNHDHYVSYLDTSLADFHPAAAQVVEWTRSQLSADDMQWLHDLPLQKPIMGFMLVHSTLDMPDHWGYVFDNQQAKANFNYQRTPLCFHGHTHVPIIYSFGSGGVVHYEPCDFTIELGQKLFINVGSVGYPRADMVTTYFIYDDVRRRVIYRELPFDFKRYILDMSGRDVALPEWLLGILLAAR